MEDRILYFIILIILIFFYKRRTSIGFLKFLNEAADENKVKHDEVINPDLSINKKLDDDVKGYRTDNKVLKWIIIIYVIYGILEFFL